MAKVISQDTFDSAVQENILEFEMAPDEAKQETIKQFEAQGISLTNIIRDLAINPDSAKPILVESLDTLKCYLDGKDIEREKLLNIMKTIDDECQKSVAHRILASKKSANYLLLTVLVQDLDLPDSKTNTDVIESILKTLNSFYNKQPDVFDSIALQLAPRLLEFYVDNERIVSLTLQWLQKCCIMHEINRQNIINANIIKYLRPFVCRESKVLRDVLALCRYLVLDDDIRVEFGCAHEHACKLAAEFIIDLTNLLSEFDDVTILADLLLTIGSLAVRQELCTSVDKAGGIKLVLEVMKNNTNAVRLNCEALKLLRALAGHDDVKSHIVQQGVSPILKELLHNHMTNENLVAAVLGCISTLTLRVKNNSKTLFDTGISQDIVESMRLHQKNKIVQRNGAWAIRNMVSRSREQCETWLSFGIEDILNAAIGEHPSILQDVKAALRDLGCKVDLKEEWTGIAEKKIINNY